MDNEPSDNHIPTSDPLTDLLALVEVYVSLPREALVLTLQARGLSASLNLEEVSILALVVLAVHTHSPHWPDFYRLSRIKRTPDGLLMLDIPV